jgi:hypothetical protein
MIVLLDSADASDQAGLADTGEIVDASHSPHALARAVETFLFLIPLTGNARLAKKTEV